MTDVWNQDANPFAPPQVVGAAARVPIVRFHPGEPLHAERLSGWHMRRRIRFRGEYDFELEWVARLAEWVAIDGEVAIRVTNWGNPIPKFEVPVFANGDALLTVEVCAKAFWWTTWRATAFRVRLDDRTLYAEGEWPDDPPEGTPSQELYAPESRDSSVASDFRESSDRRSRV